MLAGMLPLSLVSVIASKVQPLSGPVRVILRALLITPTKFGRWKGVYGANAVGLIERGGAEVY